MQTLSLKASGMVTSVGFNAQASLAAMRAGVRMVEETNLWDAESGTFLAAGRVLLPHWSIALEKLADLAAPAIDECLAATESSPDTIPLLLGVATADRPHRWDGLDERLLQEIEFRLDAHFHPRSKLIPRGRVSGVVAIQEAQQLLADPEIEVCIVAGVDSFVRQDVVEAYLEQRRLLTPTNSNGFCPGEAAAACLLGRPDRGTGPELLVLGTTLTREEATIESERPARATALTEAYRAALAEHGLTIADTDYRITDLNGEHYKSKEASLVTLRLERTKRERLFDIWHPIEYLGEIGAAIGPCTLAWAQHASSKGYAIGPRAIHHYGNDDGERAVMITEYRSTAHGSEEPQ